MHQNQLTQKKSKSHRNSFKKKNGLKSHGSNATHSAKMKSHDVGKLSKRKSHNADLSDAASTSGSSTSTKGSNSTASSASAQKNAKDAEDDTHLLFQREYLAERHYQSQTSDNQSNDPIQKIVIIQLRASIKLVFYLLKAPLLLKLISLVEIFAKNFP